MEMKKMEMKMKKGNNEENNEEGRKEGNVWFNDALNTFYLRLIWRQTW